MNNVEMAKALLAAEKQGEPVVNLTYIKPLLESYLGLERLLLMDDLKMIHSLILGLLRGEIR